MTEKDRYLKIDFIDADPSIKVRVDNNDVEYFKQYEVKDDKRIINHSVEKLYCGIENVLKKEIDGIINCWSIYGEIKISV